MDVAIWIAKAIAGAVLGQSAKEAYAKVKEILVNKFGLGSEIEVVEKNPSKGTVQALLAEELIESGALESSEFRDKVEILIQELTQSTNVSPEAQILISEIKAQEASIKRLIAEGSANISVTNVEAGKLDISDLKAKS